MKPWRLRLITNLDCNNACYFCYQPLKKKIHLELNKLEGILSKCGTFKRATIMGGEATLLDNLHEYIALAKTKAETVCLVTNGTLLDEFKLLSYRRAGLEEIAISISSLENYYQLRNIIHDANLLIYNCRINIPRGFESSGDELKHLVRTILLDGYGVVVCEDLMGRYGKPHEEVISEWDNTKLVRTDGFNFHTYEMNGMEFGLFAHYNGYNETDLIVTPVGNFSKWDKYCEAIGNYNVH